MTDWTPATETEAAMRDALAADDQELYFRILARTELLLPVSSDAIAGRAPMGWGTWTAGNRTHVLAFTSSEAMYHCLAEHAGSARRIPYHELAAAWPNLEWWLAVNPGLPIEGYLPAWFVSQLARGDVRLPGRSGSSRTARVETLGRAHLPPPRQPDAAQTGPTVGAGTTSWAFTKPSAARAHVEAAPVSVGADTVAVPGGADTAGAVTEPVAAADGQPESGPAFTPANGLEEELLTAVTHKDNDGLLSALLLGKVVVPLAGDATPTSGSDDDAVAWRAEVRDGETRVVAFTSPERLVAHLGSETPARAVRFVQLIRSWPDPTWSLVVNPDTPIAVTLRGSQIARLASSATEVGLDDRAGEAWEAGSAATAARSSTVAVEAPPMLQKAVAPSQVSWYLERGYDRVSGFVHRASEVAHLRTPAQVVQALGLTYDGSPFSETADEIYVLKWPAFIPSLYRIPYGGRTEAAMAAMQGWVIERAPFRGNGFAPTDNGDVIAEFKVDSVRLPHGAQLWRMRADGTSELVATFDADGPTWVEAGRS